MSLTRRELADYVWGGARFHEGAHAVAAMHFGYPIDGIELGVRSPLLGDPTPHGFTLVDEPDFDDPDRTDDEIANSIVIAYAGPVAEQWWLTNQPRIGTRRARQMVDRGAAGDMATVDAELGRLGASSRLARQLEREADALVAEVWEAIAAVAQALDDCNGVLSGSQVHALV